jgi:hypothetical protein
MRYMKVEIPEVEGNRRLFRYENNWENIFTYRIIEDILFRQMIQSGETIMSIEKKDRWEVKDEERAELIEQFLRGNTRNIQIIDGAVRNKAEFVKDGIMYYLYLEEEWKTIYNHNESDETTDKYIWDIEDKTELLHLAI